MPTLPHSLDPLFHPRSVAVVGASGTPGTVGSILLRNLLENPFGGVVYPINPKRNAVHGVPCYPDLASLPLERLADMEAVVLDCEGERAIGPEALADVELRYRAVLIRTGFARFWGTPSYFSEPNPFLTAPACELLVRAGALFVGIDSLNIDDTEDLSRPAHTILLDAGIPICEHMTNLAAVPASGGRLHAVPVAWVGGASFPVRAYVVVP